MSDSETAPPTRLLAERLCAHLAALETCLVAFSGGVDSAVVAAAAHRGLGRRAIAVTAVSPSVSDAQLAAARQVARQIGIAHREVATDEIENADYVRNDGQRCFHCKQTLYRRLGELAEQQGFDVIASGTNADDTHDYRPGIAAGRLARVQTPLADLGIDKAAVRAIARHWQLSVWDAPASPCLSSRLAYGVSVTADRLKSVETAEAFLAAQGFSPLRVRLHEGELARIEIDRGELPRLLAEPLWSQTVTALRAAGFRFVTVDLEGFRSGNLNTLVSLSAPTVSSSSCVTHPQDSAE